MTRWPWDPETVAVLRLPSFQSYAVSRGCGATASILFQTAILWQVYELTGSPIELGIIGLIRFVPTIALNLVGGATADTYDRRRVLMVAQGGALLAALVMLGALVSNTITLGLLYGVALVTSAVNSFDTPARQGLLQVVVPRRLFRSAIIVNQTLQATASVTGPAVAGVLIAWRGADAAYAVYAALLATSMVSLLTMRFDTAEHAARRGVTLSAMLEGLAYLWHRPVLLGIMALDLFAVIFGGARALLPIYAVDILHAGATGYGILSAASEVGSLACAVALLVLPKPAQTGRTMLMTVSAYGVTTILFGLSTWLPLAVVFYAATGVADQVSVVMRSTAIQLNTPDELRGRVTSVHSTFTNSSGHLGAVESGLVAGATNAVFSVVSGGVAVLVVVAVVAWLVPELRTFRAQAATLTPLQEGQSRWRSHVGW